jgi:hypothetical protein
VISSPTKSFLGGSVTKEELIQLRETILGLWPHTQTQEWNQNTYQHIYTLLKHTDLPTLTEGIYEYARRGNPWPPSPSTIYEMWTTQQKQTHSHSNETLRETCLANGHTWAILHEDPNGREALCSRCRLEHHFPPNTLLTESETQ